MLQKNFIFFKNIIILNINFVILYIMNFIHKKSIILFKFYFCIFAN